MICAQVKIKEEITKLDPAHPMAIVDKKAAKKKAAAEKKAAAAAAGAKPAAEGGDKPMSKNAQKALAKKQAKLAKKAQHKENAAANAPPPPPSSKAEPAKEGDLAAALTAIAAQTAGPLASKAAHWRSLAPQACGNTPMEKAKCAEWMGWAEAPPADAAAPADPPEEEEEEEEPAAAAVSVAVPEAAPGARRGGGGREAAAASPGSKDGGSGGKGEGKRVLPEKARRELAKQLRAMTGASARLCEKALQSHADDMDRAANWLLDQGETKDE